MTILTCLVGLRRSLLARIALAYLVSLLLLSAATAWFALNRAGEFRRELQQRVNLNLAKTLSMTISPTLVHGVESDAARSAAQHILAINPSLSLYVLDIKGRVIAAYNKTGCGLGARVLLGPVHELLDRNHRMFPVFSINPCSNQPNVFSVARVQYGADQPGFLYVALTSQPDESMSSMLRTSYVLRGILTAGGIALLLAGAVGLAWFALLTRRFRTLTHNVERFAAGDFAQRAESPKDDEIGQLAQAFNNMANTIEAQLQALQETDRQRRDLVTNLSHDFRTPLTSLRGHAEQLRESLEHSANSTSRNEHWQAIFNNVDRLTQLAKQLSLLTRLDAYEQPLRIEPFSLRELIQDVLQKFEPQALKQQITLRDFCASDLPMVPADIALIERLLSNLIDNALRATAVGGHIEIKASRDKDAVVVSVADDGCGIAADELPLISQRFYRTRSSRTSDRDGSGLGLSIVHEIVEQHGGELSIKSMLGNGTLVRVLLPTTKSRYL